MRVNEPSPGTCLDRWRGSQRQVGAAHRLCALL